MGSRHAKTAKLPARSVDDGQDRKIPPAPGTNQIAGYKHQGFRVSGWNVMHPGICWDKK